MQTTAKTVYRPKLTDIEKRFAYERRERQKRKERAVNFFKATQGGNDGKLVRLERKERRKAFLLSMNNPDVRKRHLKLRSGWRKMVALAMEWREQHDAGEIVDCCTCTTCQEKRIERALSKAEMPKVTIIMIMEFVCTRYGITKIHLKSNRRKREIVVPRQEFCWLVSHLTGASLKTIGRILGGKDHTTILHAIRRYQDYSDGKILTRSGQDHLILNNPQDFFNG